MKKQCKVLTSLAMIVALLLANFSFAADVYTVKSGDVLWRIAAAHGTTWQELAKINKMENPNLIFPNQKIKLKADDVAQTETKVDTETADEVAAENKAAAKSIQILHTNDMHGFFIEGKYDGMGAAKVKTVFEQKKAENPNTLVLDAGDAMQGANLVTLSKGAKAAEVMNALGYDFMVAGNHEFDYGQAQLDKNAKALNFPMLACNVQKADGSSLLPEYMVRVVDGVKIAVVGFATPETTFKSHPDNTQGLIFEAPAVAAERVVKMLNEQVKPDLIIAVAHLGEEGEFPAATVAKVGGVDVIVDGHSHVKYPEGIWENDTLIVSTGEKTKNVGIVTINLDENNKVLSKKAELFTKKMAADIEPNAEIAALIDEIKAENKKIEDVVVGNTTELLQGERAFVRTGETNLGNLLTAALLDISGADIAFTNGGGIRASIPVGDITKGQILQVLPFGNTVRMIELSGKDVKAAMENGISDFPTPKGAFPHIAGMAVEFDSSKEAGNKITKITVNGQPLEDEKIYTLVTNDFLVAGGDDYEMFKGKKVVGEYGAMDEILIDYLAKNGIEAGKITNRIVEVKGVKPDLEKH